MCLSRISEPKIAQEDIICYKIVDKVNTFLSDYVGKGKIVICGVEFNCEVGRLFPDIVMYRSTLTEKTTFSAYIYMGNPNISSLTTSDGRELITSTIYRTYYQEMEVSIGETYVSDFSFKKRRIYEGLHSFKTKRIKTFLTYKSVVMKCIIPKGTVYYEGYFQGHKSYASNQLKYLEICV